jgi:hypothetical protein
MTAAAECADVQEWEAGIAAKAADGATHSETAVSRAAIIRIGLVTGSLGKSRRVQDCTASDEG